MISLPPNFLKNQDIINFTKEMADVCQPKDIHWCDGSQEEYDSLCSLLVQNGTFKKLNQERWPNSYACNSEIDHQLK